MKFLSATVLISVLWVVTGATKIPIKQSVAADTSAAQVPHFLVKDAGGKMVDVAAQKGKIVFLNFWALSCVPCKAEMPTINRLHDHYRNDTNVLILPVDLDNDRVNTAAYMRASGFGLVVYNTASQVPEELFKGVLPTTVVIDKEGRIIFFHEGVEDYGTAKFMGYMDSLGTLPK